MPRIGCDINEQNFVSISFKFQLLVLACVRYLEVLTKTFFVSANTEITLDGLAVPFTEYEFVANQLFFCAAGEDMSSVNTSSNKIRLAPATPNISDVYAVPITTDVHLNFSFSSVDSDVKYNLYRDGVLIEVFSQTNYSSFGSTGFDYLDPGIKGLFNALNFLYYPKIYT